MNLKGSRFVPNNRCLHEYVGREVKVKPLNYEREVIGEVKTVLTNTVCLHVKQCEPIDRFTNNEKSHFAVAYLKDVKKYLEESVIAK